MINIMNLKGKKISYHLEHKNVKNINLRIKADQNIYVSANYSVSTEEIESLLRKKSDYILKSLDYYAEAAKFRPKPKEYVNGESFRILGRNLRLKVEKGTRNTVKSDESYITLTVKDPFDKNLKKRITAKWIRNYCKELIIRVCEEIYPKFQKYGVKFPEIKLRNMISRWGSCQPQKCILTFNVALIETPLSCIEYVVTHEFTHFMQPNHSKNFYNQLSMFMPDWKQRKQLLEKEYIYTE